MNSVDLVILVILLFGAYRGFQTGLVLEIVSIVAFFVAILGGFKLIDLGKNMLESFEDTLGNFMPIAAFILVFVIILIVINLAGRLFKKIIDFTILGSFDNFAGALLGMLKFTLFLSILNWVIISMGFDLPDMVSKDSAIYPYVAMIGPAIGNFLFSLFPSLNDLVEKVGDFLRGLSR